MKIESLADQIEARAGRFRERMSELLDLSGFKDRDGVGARQYAWEPLPLKAARLQRVLWEDLAALRSEIHRAFDGDQPSIWGAADSTFEICSAAIAQEKKSTHSDLSAIRDSIQNGLRWIVSRLRDRGSGDSGWPLLIADTSALYERSQLAEWKFLELPQFTIVLVGEIFGELDRHAKQTDDTERRRKAQSLLRQIEDVRERSNGLLHGAPLVKGRSLLLLWPYPPDFDLNESLDADVPDDRIIAAALSLRRRHPISPVAVVTKDINMRNKCEMVRLPFCRPPADDGSVPTRRGSRGKAFP